MRSLYINGSLFTNLQTGGVLRVGFIFGWTICTCIAPFVVNSHICSSGSLFSWFCASLDAVTPTTFCAQGIAEWIFLFEFAKKKFLFLQEF